MVVTSDKMRREVLLLLQSFLLLSCKLFKYTFWKNIVAFLFGIIFIGRHTVGKEWGFVSLIALEFKKCVRVIEQKFTPMTVSAQVVVSHFLFLQFPFPTLSAYQYLDYSFLTMYLKEAAAHQRLNPTFCWHTSSEARKHARTRGRGSVNCIWTSATVGVNVEAASSATDTSSQPLTVCKLNS